jgi:hypothetical protein
MLSECELIDTENIILLSQYMKLVEHADIFQYQSYSHSDDMFITLKSSITMDIWDIYLIGFNICIFEGKTTLINFSSALIHLGQIRFNT